MSAKVILELKIKEFKDLSEFLDEIEYEICEDVDGLGALKSLFVAVFEQDPKPV